MNRTAKPALGGGLKLAAQALRPPADIVLPCQTSFIGGRWLQANADRRLNVVDPATGETRCELSPASTVDAEQAINAARKTFDTGLWSSWPATQRMALLHRVADLIEQRRSEFAWREAVNVGTLYRDAFTVSVPHAAKLFRYYAGLCQQLEGRIKPVEPTPLARDSLALVAREPLGVVAAFTPYNLPLALSAAKLAPALAAGNTIVHKPSPMAVLSVCALAGVLQEAGVPDGVYNLLVGAGAEVGELITRSQKVDAISFTGSTATGRRIAADAAQTVKRLHLELGGKSAHIVLADADLDRAANQTFLGAFWNKGEVCAAGSRLLVDRTVLEPFLSRLRTRIGRARIGNPLDPRSDIGPLANPEALERVRSITRRAVDSGLRAAVGADVEDTLREGYFAPLTLLTDVPDWHPAFQTEIFGPVATVTPFDNPEQAISLANVTDYGLGAGIQTSDLAKGLRLAKRLHAGVVWINTWHQYDVTTPFGGWKQSGYGVEDGHEGLDVYLRYKTVWASLDS
jgi:aldehyde dehydrogenase (NAD+)